MASPSRVMASGSARADRRAGQHVLGGVRFDLTVALLSTWFVIGVYVDGWAHNNGIVDGSFFTPYHALLYSGVAAAGLFLGITQFRNVNQGYAWRFALPKGYLLSLIGVVLFLLGGGFDFVWHSLFGFEADRAALLSPSHLLLAVSGGLILTGPIRAAWSRTKSEQRQGWIGFLPIIISITLLAGLLLFFSMYANPFMTWWASTGRHPSGQDEFFRDVLTITSAVISTTVLTSVLLFALRRWGKQLPFGSITFIMLVNTVFSFWLSLGLDILPLPERAATLLCAVLAGTIGDILLRVQDPRRGGWGLRAFAFIVPFLWVVAYYVLLDTIQGMWWVIHLSLGTAFITGIAGLLLSYLMLPPAFPDEAR